MAVLPHVASIGFIASAQEDLTFPTNLNAQAMFPPIPQAKLNMDSYGMAYDEGLMYCSPTTGVCIYNKLGSNNWTEPSEMQSGFVAQTPGYAVMGGKLWVSGGSPTMGNN